MMYAVDIETACHVIGCPWHRQAMCKNDHSLSPWHSRITCIGVVDANTEHVFRGPAMMGKFNSWLLDRREQGDTVTGHGFKFDALHLIKHGASQADLFNVWKHDTHLLGFVWTEKVSPEWLDSYTANKPKNQRAAGPHSLKTMAPYFLGVTPYWEVADKDSDEYVLTDTRHTHALQTYLLGNVPADQQAFVDDRLLPWTKMLVEAELRGLKLDVPGLLAYRVTLEAEERSLCAELDVLWADGHRTYSALKRDAVHRKYDSMKDTKAREPRRLAAIAKSETRLSYDSPTQMRWLLSEFLGYDLTSLEGGESTGKEVLTRLREEGKEDIGVFLNWRKTQKILQAFIPGILEGRDEYDTIHPILNPTGARTGRLSAERINTQQVPKSLKRFFSAGKGRVILGYDAKAIEAKLIAAYTEDKNFCRIVMSGESFHDFNAKEFFNLDCAVEEVSELYPKERRAAKTIGFAVIFGAGANRIRIAMNQAGFNVSLQEAKRIYNKYRETYAGAFEYSANIVEHLESGAVINNLLGRPLKIQVPQDCYMKAVNLIVQSSASDLNLDRALALITRLRSQGIDATPHLFVHDYIGISVPERDAYIAHDIALNQVLPETVLPTSLGDIRIDYEGGISDHWT